MDSRIDLFRVHLPQNLDKLYETLNSGYVSEGPKVKEFEKKIISWVNNDNTIALNSGTSALHLALVLAGVEYQDLVITTPLTSPATNVSIVNLGAQIIWADIDKNNLNISPASISKLLKKHRTRVKAIIAVDWGGITSGY